MIKIFLVTEFYQLISMNKTLSYLSEINWSLSHLQFASSNRFANLCGVIIILIFYIYIKSMVNLKSQKRLASEVLKCGKKRVWMDPS
jgi:hypothetical protein